jgi:hypothetical protein
MGGRTRSRSMGRQGWWRVVVPMVVAAVSVAMAGPAFALPPGGGGGGGGGGGTPDCTHVSASLSLSATNVVAFQSVSATWTTHRPSGCGGTSRLVGPGASGVPISTGSGSETFVPPLGGGTYAVVMTIPGNVVTTGWTTVTVAHGPLVNIAHAIEPTSAVTCLATTSTVVGAPVDVENCDGSTGQAFQFWPVAGIANGFYVTTSQGFCLAQSPDTLVSQFPCPTQLDPELVWITGAFQAFPDIQLMRNYGVGGCMTAVGNLPWDTLVGATTARVFGLGPSTVGLLLQECNPINVGQPWIQVDRT